MQGERSQRDWIMAVLKGYFDDSGKEESPALSIAGYVGVQRIWDVFELEWKRALDRNDIPYFHMKDISKPKSPMHKFYGQDNKERSRALFQDLAGALNRCWSLQEFALFGCVVPREPLEKFNR